MPLDAHLSLWQQSRSYKERSLPRLPLLPVLQLATTSVMAERSLPNLHVEDRRQAARRELSSSMDDSMNREYSSY